MCSRDQAYRVCKVGDKISSPAQVNRSIIQGSGIGLTLYIAMKSDLTPISTYNLLIKYADDVDLLVPETSDVDLATEFQGIMVWAALNKMVINFQKTKEIVFHRPNPRNIVFPAAIGVIEQVAVAKLLSVFIECNFKCDEHVK